MSSDKPKMYYKIFPEKKLIYEYISGLFTISTYSELKHQTWSDPLYNPDYNVISDYKDTLVDLPGAIYKKVIEFNLEHKEYFGKRKAAIVTSNEKQAVDSFLYEKEAPIKLPLDTKIFTTLQAACSWCDVSYDELIQNIDI